MITPELQPRLFKIKPEYRQEWFDWCSSLNGELREEGGETLRQENVSHEFFINFEINDSWYALGVAITNDGALPHEADMSLTVNKRHRMAKRRCLEFMGVTNYAYYLTSSK